MNKEEALKHLFEEANEKRPLEFLFALLRVGWIESYEEDPLKKFEKVLTNSKAIERNNIDLQNAKDFWGLIANLSRIAGKEQYRPDIFFAAETKNHMTESVNLVHKDLAIYLKSLFPDNWSSLSKEQRILAQGFISDFFKKYQEVFKSFIDSPTFFKLPGFEVLELLVNKNEGLFGFKVHFSNGSHAEFKRTNKGASGVNLAPAPGQLSFNIGNRDELKHEWVVGEKRLFELGIPGRYNRPGEWTPIVYPGDSGSLQKEAIKLAKGDEQTEGIYFYILCTGYWCIELAVKTTTDLPDKITGLPGDVLLYKVEPDVKFQSEIVYDGAYYLKDYKLETIQEGIQKILRAMNGLSLTFDKPVHWELKYKIRSHTRGSASAKKEDIKFLNKITTELQKEQDPYIDAAVDWYQRGIASRNVFNAFICFHIAIEGLAIKMIEGKLKASEYFDIKGKFLVDKKGVIDCIEEFRKKYYSSDPSLFVTKAYLDCVQSLKGKIKFTLEKIFGKSHKYLKEYFEVDDSLWDLRGELIHKAYSDWHFEKKELVRKKLYVLQDIAKEFLIRVIMQIKPDKKAPSWSGHSFIGISMFNPKGALVVSHLRFFPIKDWKIKASWIESR